MRPQHLLTLLFCAIATALTTVSSTSDLSSPTISSDASSPTQTSDESPAAGAKNGITTSRSTPLPQCTSSASARRSICNRAVMSIHKDGLDDEPYTVDLQQCACTSLSMMIGCYRADVQSKSEYLSSWSASSCAALITGRISEVGLQVTASPSISNDRLSSSQVVSSSSRGAANGRKRVLDAWIEEAVILVLVAGLAN